MKTGPRYTGQKLRARRTPPHVSIGDLRNATGLTIDQFIERMKETTGLVATRGSISAIENGQRGASKDLLRAIALTYGLKPDAVTTDYQPRSRAEDAA